MQGKNKNKNELINDADIDVKLKQLENNRKLHFYIHTTVINSN